MGEILRIVEAVTSNKSSLRPCGDCELDPGTCSQQVIGEVPFFNTVVSCKLKDSPVRRETKLLSEGIIRLDRLRLREGRIETNGKPNTNQEISAAAEAAL